MGHTHPVVLDASALLDFLTGQPLAGPIGSVLANPLVSLHVPMHLDEEVLSVFRRLERATELSAKNAEVLLRDVSAFHVNLHPVRSHFDRVWALRHMIHTSDAHYASLAEVLDAALLTTDQWLVAGATAASGIKIVPLAE